MKNLKLFVCSIGLVGLVGCGASKKYEVPASVNTATVKFQQAGAGKVHKAEFYIQVAKKGCFTTKTLGDFQKKASLGDSMAKVPANTPIAIIASYDSRVEQCEVPFPVRLQANKTYTMTMLVTNKKCLLLLKDGNKPVSRLKLKFNPDNRNKLCEH